MLICIYQANACLCLEYINKIHRNNVFQSWDLVWKKKPLYMKEPLACIAENNTNSNKYIYIQLRSASFSITFFVFKQCSDFCSPSHLPSHPSNLCSPSHLPTHPSIQIKIIPTHPNLNMVWIQETLQKNGHSRMRILVMVVMQR